MTIKRGTMDNALVCVFPWERPIIEEIHGGGAECVSIEDLCDLKGPTRVATIPMPYAKDVPEGKTKEPGLSMREQYLTMCKVDPDRDPQNDPGGEFGRLCALYGMHEKVPMPVVEKVYGSERQFVTVMRRFRSATPPPNAAAILGYDDGNDEAVEDDGEQVVAEMTREQLVAFLKSKEIDFPKTAGIEKLRDLATMVLAEA